MSIVIGNEYDLDKTYEDGKQYTDDDKLLVRFEVRAVKNEFRTKLEGRPIFEDAEFIQIIVPGSRDISAFPVDDGYRQRFHKAYAKWKAHEQQKIDGTILSEMSWLTRSQVAELNYSNIFTVEQLANLSDANARQFMGSHQLRERAKNYLAQAAGEAPMAKLQAELEQRDNHIATLEGQIASMQKAIEELQSKRK